MLIDLHTHTRRHSWDSDLTPDELIEHSKRTGLDGICLTEHDFFWDLAEVRELSRRHSFLVLPGVEINTDDGHMLCFGLESYVYGMHRVAELAAHVQRAGGVLVAAHPYRRQLPWRPDDAEDQQRALTRAAANPAYAVCAALEQINGRGSDVENAFAAAVCDSLGRPTTAGSDAHVAADIGRCATDFTDRIESLADLIEALKRGRCRAVDLRIAEYDRSIH
jgi:predicted metal-dependent phosphoesterase TrpH